MKDVHVREHTRKKNGMDVQVRSYTRSIDPVEHALDGTPENTTIEKQSNIDFQGAQNYWYFNNQRDVWLYDPSHDEVHIVKGMEGDIFITNKGTVTRDNWSRDWTIGSYARY